MAVSNQTIKCLIFTLRTENVLVPRAAVADMISVRDVTKVSDSPEWMMGVMEWRGHQIPIISFEAVGGLSVNNVSANTQVAVLHAMGGKLGESSYMGLVISGVPHEGVFTRDQIKEDVEVIGGHPMVAQKVRVNGASVSILDLDAMEGMLVEGD